MKTMSLMEVNTLDQLCRLTYDNVTAGDFWLLSDAATVTIAAQKVGESPSARVTMTRKDFNQLVRAYTRQQRLRSTPTARAAAAEVKGADHE